MLLDIPDVEYQDPPMRNILIVWEEAHGINAKTMCTLWL